MLASDVSITTSFTGLETETSTFDLTLNSDLISGTYEAWCINAEIGIKANGHHVADLYSGSDIASLAPLTGAGQALEGQTLEHMGSINWLLNWYDGSNEGISNYDVQATIWQLLGDDWSALNGLADSDDVSSLYQDALNNQDFVAGINDSQTLILDVQSSEGHMQQPLILEYNNPPAVPEASAAAMLAGGLLVLAAIKKLRA